MHAGDLKKLIKIKIKMPLKREIFIKDGATLENIQPATYYILRYRKIYP